MKRNKEKFTEIIAEMQTVLAERHNVDKVWAMVYGHRVKLTERQVRALCVVAMHKALVGEDAFKDFRDNVVVYDPKRGENKFTPSGLMERPFSEGFFDCIERMHLALIKNERTGKRLFDWSKYDNY